MKRIPFVFPFALLALFVMAGLTARAEETARQKAETARQKEEKAEKAEKAAAKFVNLTVGELWLKTDQEKALWVSEATYALIRALNAERNAQGILKPSANLEADRNVAAFIRDSLTMRTEEESSRLPYLGAELFELITNVAKVMPDTNILQVLISFSTQKYRAYLGSTGARVDVSPIPRPQDVKRLKEIQNDARSGKITAEEAKARIEKINSDQWDQWVSVAMNFPGGVKVIRNRNGVWYRIEGTRTECRLVRWD